MCMWKLHVCMICTCVHVCSATCMSVSINMSVSMCTSVCCACTCVLRVLYADGRQAQGGQGGSFWRTNRLLLQGWLCDPDPDDQDALPFGPHRLAQGWAHDPAKHRTQPWTPGGKNGKEGPFAGTAKRAAGSLEPSAAWSSRVAPLNEPSQAVGPTGFQRPCVWGRLLRGLCWSLQICSVGFAVGVGLGPRD